MNLLNSISPDKEHILLGGRDYICKFNYYLRGECSKSFRTIFVIKGFAYSLKSLISIASTVSFICSKALASLKLIFTLDAGNKLLLGIKSSFFLAFWQIFAVQVVVEDSVKTIQHLILVFHANLIKVFMLEKRPVMDQYYL